MISVEQLKGLGEIYGFTVMTCMLGIEFGDLDLSPKDRIFVVSVSPTGAEVWREWTFGTWVKTPRELVPEELYTEWKSL